MAYSTDLRESAVNYFLNHELSYNDVSAIFGIGTATLHRWVSAYKHDGCLEYETSPGRPRLLCLEKEASFQELVMNNSDHTLDQLSEIWEAQQGQKLSSFTLSRSIRRLGFTRKKRRFGLQSERERLIKKSAENIYLA